MPGKDRISKIYMKLRGSLARAVLGIVPPKEIEDIVQETYVRVCQIENKDAIKEPKAFLFKVARNLALDYVKRAETRLMISEEDAGNSVFAGMSQWTNETLDQAVSHEEFGEFCEAVRKLPAQRRRAFVLKKVYGYTQREIAAQMQLSEKTVERHIALGMDSCIEYLSRHGEMTIGRGSDTKVNTSEESNSGGTGGRS